MSLPQTASGGSTWPSVSAIVATRDRPEALRRAIVAILGQDYPARVEVVVVFDQSEPADLSDVMPLDGTDRTLTVIRNHRSPGLAGARNAGAEKAFGDVLAFCDDDDEWLPGKLRLQVEAMEASGADTAVAGIEIAYADRRVVRVPQEDRVTQAQLLRSRVTEVHPSTVLVRREAFAGPIGPVDEEIPGSYGEDYEWLLRAVAHGPIVAVTQPLVRVHWGQASFFADRWQTIADAIAYLLDTHPELAADRRNLARLYGRVAFAHAALGHRAEARRWAAKSLRTRPLERRPYLALAVTTGAIEPATIQRWANRAGRGV
jgi:glycosyltransferase involved in cell wall biosynthesis